MAGTLAYPSLAVDRSQWPPLFQPSGSCSSACVQRLAGSTRCWLPVGFAEVDATRPRQLRGLVVGEIGCSRRLYRFEPAPGVKDAQL